MKIPKSWSARTVIGSSRSITGSAASCFSSDFDQAYAAWADVAGMMTTTSSHWDTHQAAHKPSQSIETKIRNLCKVAGKAGPRMRR
jgi:hypothetical protein